MKKINAGKITKLSSKKQKKFAKKMKAKLLRKLSKVGIKKGWEVFPTDKHLSGWAD